MAAVSIIKDKDLPSGSNVDVENGLAIEENGRTGSLGVDDLGRMQIVYKDLRFTVSIQQKGSKAPVKKDILKGLNGIIQPGRLTAVVGASGAGKTSFLNVLAGFHKGNTIVSGEITVNGEVTDGNRMRLISGFVHQEDVIMDTMTVREALMFAAQLKMPKDISYELKEKRAMDIADLLNLRKSLDSLVGSALIKGISGGEKRRLSVGMEMLTNPSILFLDEPTSGLDSYTAYKVVRILSTVAHRYHRTVMCTIHQPSSEVFAMFDDVIVLAEGQIVYHGAVTDMVPYFTALGYPCPNNFNPADHLFMEILNAGNHGGSDDQFDFIVSGNDDDEAVKQKAKEAEAARINGLITAWEKSEANQKMMSQMQHQETWSHGIDERAIQKHASFWTQFRLLAYRAAANAWRNQLILKGKLAQTIFLSIVVGLIYLRLDTDEKGVQDREGSLFFIIVQGLFGSVMGMLTVFGGEKVVFEREFGSSRMYSLPAYFISRNVVQLPIQIVLPVLSSVIIYWMIGYQNTAAHFGWFALILVLMDNCGAALGVFVSCLFNDIGVALAVMPMFLLPLMVFSGFFVNSTSLGWWFRWIVYISPFKYGFIALIKNEFQGLLISCDPGKDSGCSPQGVRTGENVIELLGFDNQGSIGMNAGVLFALMWAFLILAYVALWAAIRRSQK